eukprot:Nk52_evm96s352 gene=Nk52_evmTU96s352
MTTPEDRRLRPVYSAIDSGNNKVAIQLCDRLLSKKNSASVSIGENILTRVLKSLALQRYGKVSEANEVMLEVEKETVLDETTLQTMAIVLKDMGCHDRVINLYQRAVATHPNASSELYMQLFMGYVRKFDFKSQQQIALAMYKKFNLNNYLFWAVMSLVMQVHEARSSDDEATRKKAEIMLLPLAHRFMEKSVQDGKAEKEEDTRLFYTILMLENKPKEAQALFEDVMLKKFNIIRSEELKTMVILAMANGDYQRAHDSNVSIIKENSDDWSAYTGYFEAVGKIGMSMTRINEVFDFIEGLEETERLKDSAKGINRGPFLAKLQLYVEASQWGDDYFKVLDDKQTLESSILMYFKKFSSKVCCFEDMKRALELARVKGRGESVFGGLHEFFNNHIENPSSDEKSDAIAIKRIYSKLCLHQTKRFVGLLSDGACSFADQQEEVCMLLGEYVHALALGKNLKETEDQHGDRFLLLAIHLLLDIFHRSRDSSIIVFCMGWLKFGLEKSSYNFQFKLLLIKFYAALGAFDIAVDVYESMDVKHIQCDVMGFAATDYAYFLGCVSEAERVYNDIILLYNSNDREVPEMMTLAYRHGTYSKIPEFKRLHERLSNSLQKAHTLSELIMLNYVNTVDYDGLRDVLNYTGKLDCTDSFVSKLRDNRDVRVMDFWDYEASLEDNVQKSAEIAGNMRREWVKLRSLILSILAGITNCKVDSCVDHLNSLKKIPIVEWAKEKTFDDGKGVGRNFFKNFPARTVEIIDTLFQLASAFWAAHSEFVIAQKETKPELVRKAVKDIEVILGHLNNSIAEISSPVHGSIKACRTMLDFGDCVERTMFLVENLSFSGNTIGLFLSLCKDVLNSLTYQAGGGKKKKKITNQNVLEIVHSFESLQLVLCEGLKRRQTELSQLATEIDALTSTIEQESGNSTKFVGNTLDSSMLKQIVEVMKLKSSQSGAQLCLPDWNVLEEELSNSYSYSIGGVRTLIDIKVNALAEQLRETPNASSKSTNLGH